MCSRIIKHDANMCGWLLYKEGPRLMGRRPSCLGNHDWVHVQRAATPRLDCSRCPATFPCQEPCAHTDCEEATGKTAICPVCSAPVAYLDGFHFTRYGKTVRVHLESCLAQSPQPQESEEEETAA